MGNIGSRPDEGGAVFLRDQNRFTISSLSITNPKKRSTITITPNAFPATRVSASRPLGDNGPIEFVQDTELAASGAAPGFMLKLSNDDELVFRFDFIIRQSRQSAQPPTLGTTPTDGTPPPVDASIGGLTFVHGSTSKEVDNLVTREFHANPNLHKNPQVELVGDYSTGGSPSVTFEWTWKWKPPKALDEKSGGWRNSCSFVEYDARVHKLLTLASFSFWVSTPSPASRGDSVYLGGELMFMRPDGATPMSYPSSPAPLFTLNPPPRIRVGSAQSADSRYASLDHDDPPSPMSVTHELASTLMQTPSSSLAHISTNASTPVRVDVACPKPGDDMTVSDDGPLFRATIKGLEQKTGNMRAQVKRLLRKAENAYQAQQEAHQMFAAFMETLKETSATNQKAVQPAIDHYFHTIAQEIQHYETESTINLLQTIIEPLSKLYATDIKQADNKKREFEEESKDYYAYVARYLGQRHDSVKTKKLAESDSKYQTKRRNFELKRFDYSSFMQDLHGGRKDQEVLSHLTRYATNQASKFLATAKRIDEFLPQLEALSAEVQEADKEYQWQRREREEKRRHLEKSSMGYIESELPPPPSVPGSSNGAQQESELGRADSTGSILKGSHSNTPGSVLTGANELSRSPGSLQTVVGSPSQNAKFKGYRDLEERDPSHPGQAEKDAIHRKEGLLWALSRPPGLHVDPRALKQWHKFWIVLDQGRLSEYSNWKQRLDLHMDPIDLRMASVREARNAERRFCFEIITPNSKRTYQATSEEDMNSWITAINNALQTAVERGVQDRPDPIPSPVESSSFKRDIGLILTGKTHSLHSSHNPVTGSSSSIPARRTTVGARPGMPRTSSIYDENPDKLLQMVRDNDQGNCVCADCGGGSKVEWVSINLGIIVCIECSGIHRSLGTHISKVRSLTLDITSFTPDIIEILLLIGNRVSNMVWEAKLDPALKPSPQVNREQRLRFITAKYVDKAFVEPISATLSRYGTADETLLAAIKKNEIQRVLYALALKANPNITDRSRGTHAVYLALAAADPAAPSATTSGSSTATTPATSDSDVRQVPFAVAELLLQNGSELPTAPPAIPLGHSATQYLEQKRVRGTTASTVPTPSLSTKTPSEMMQRDKDARLQKRISAGGRLTKSPIPER
jgi:Arf-GAP/SH3 domain/ANK repeat/PH domain-containing protein